MEKRLSVLEIYKTKGWLNNPQSKWSSDDRLNVGLRLAKDFYLAGLMTISGIDYSKERVDCSISATPEMVLQARDRYNKAIRTIPADFFRTVVDVCCHNLLVKGIGDTERQKDNDRYRKVFDLCRGLDYLVEFYLKRK